MNLTMRVERLAPIITTLHPNEHPYLSGAWAPLHPTPIHRAQAMSARFETINLEFSPEERRRFVDGELSREWFERYPEIFDDDDFSNAVTQPKNHFFEWTAAIWLFNQTGLSSLLGKYGRLKTRERKQRVIDEFHARGLITPTLLDLMKHPEKYGHPKAQQCPHLFVYAPDYTHWYFCETKGRSEPYHGGQEAFFQALADVSGKPLKLIRFRTVLPYEDSRRVASERSDDRPQISRADFPAIVDHPGKAGLRIGD